jgi:hypothetical protein
MQLELVGLSQAQRRRLSAASWVTKLSQTGVKRALFNFAVPPNPPLNLFINKEHARVLLT